jgi:hypothetical protein
MGLWPAAVWSEVPPGVGGQGAGSPTGGVCTANTLAPTLSNVVFWSAADRLLGLYAEGDPVGSLTDLSGNGNHALSSGSNRPIWRASVSQAGITPYDLGKPGLEYSSAAGTKLIIPSHTYNPSSFTIAVVMSLAVDASIIYEFASTADCYAFGDNGESIKQKRGATTSAKDTNPHPWAYTPSGLPPRLFVAQYDGTHAGHTLRQNKVALATTSVTAGDPGTASLTSTLSLGSRSGSLASTGYFFEWWVISPICSAADLGLLEDYLYSRWCLASY